MKTEKLSLRPLLPTGVLLALLPACNLMCPYNIDQFVETQTRAECHFWFSCCTAGEHALAATSGRGFPDLSNFRDEEHCVSERLEEGSPLNEVARAVIQAEQGGRFKFDATVWQGCNEPRINALNNCDADFILGDAAPLETPEVCEAVPPGTGLVPDGGDCFFAFECAASGSDCLSANVFDKLDPDAEPVEPDEIIITRPTICIAPLKDGDDCSVDPERPALPTTCEPGLICFAATDGDQTCQGPHQKDEDCNFGGDCDVGLFCDTTDGIPGACSELKQESDACTDDLECDIGLDCLVDGEVQECTAALPVNVEVCNGVQGAADPTYPSKP